eukprot:Skav205799  [mRNA]  locus=scaffold307:151254:153263:- [translate_table: standard]
MSVAAMASTNVSRGTMFMAVLTTIVTAYPFYAILLKLSNPDLETFVPCNDAPCNFQRLFTGQGIAGTAPDVLAVQNGIARPLVINDEFKAVLVDYNLVEARIIPRTLFLLAGFNDYIWPCVAENCTAPVSRAFQVCVFGICVDDDTGLSLGGTLGTWENFWILKSDRIDHAIQTVQDFRANQSKTNLTQTQLLQTEGFLWNSNFIQLYYQSWAAFINFYSGLFLTLFGESTVSGSEKLQDGICPEMTLQEMKDKCASKEMKKIIAADMGRGRGAMVYTWCIVLWVVLKAAHDLMVLTGCTEELSLFVGLLCVPVQGAAAASSALVFIAAIEVFVAQVPYQPCQCYYKMRDWDALLLLATPSVLALTYLKKVHTVDLSLLCGDLLHYRSFDVPFHLLKEHERWSDDGLMLPTVWGSAVKRELSPLAPARIPSFRLLACWFVFDRGTYNFMNCSFLLLWGVFVAKLMMLLTMTSLETESQLAWPAKLCSCSLVALPLFVALWHGNSVGGKIRLIWNAFRTSFLVLCLLPPVPVLAGVIPTQADLLLCSTRWTMAGGWFTWMTLTFGLNKINGAYKIANTLFACLAYQNLIGRSLLGKRRFTALLVGWPGSSERQRFMESECIHLPSIVKETLLDEMQMDDVSDGSCHVSSDSSYMSLSSVASRDVRLAADP